MEAPHMLYIQESNSLNTTRVFRTYTLNEALETMIKVYSEIKLEKENCKEAIFDLQEALNYFEQAFEVRFFEELPAANQNQPILGDFQVRNMRIFDKKMLLDQLVDFLAGSLTQEPKQQQCYM